MFSSQYELCSLSPIGDKLLFILSFTLSFTLSLSSTLTCCFSVVFVLFFCCFFSFFSVVISVVFFGLPHQRDLLHATDFFFRLSILTTNEFRIVCSKEFNHCGSTSSNIYSTKATNNLSDFNSL
jgi:hypothetical protein